MTTSTSETAVKLTIEELARAALEEASANLGSDVVLLDTRNVSDFTDFFVIASGETERHLEMMSDRIERKDPRVGYATKQSRRFRIWRMATHRLPRIHRPPIQS